MYGESSQNLTGAEKITFFPKRFMQTDGEYTDGHLEIQSRLATKKEVYSMWFLTWIENLFITFRLLFTWIHYTNKS